MPFIEQKPEGLNLSPGPVTATINYVTTQDKFEPPEPLFSYTFSPQPEGRPQTNERYEPQEVQINDIRQHSDLTLETAGFQVVNHPTNVDEEEFKHFNSNLDHFEQNEEGALKEYFDEIETLLRNTIPGVRKVITYNRRTRLHKPKTKLGGYDFTANENFPVLRPHIDLTPDSAAQLVAPYTEGAARVLVVNAWRPIRGVVLDAPLAVTDARTVNDAARVRSRIIYKDKEKGTYFIRNEGVIQWYFQSAQTPDEVLLFKQYDSAKTNQTPGHTAFIDDRFDGQEGVLPRFSIETRSIVLLDG